MVIITKTTFSFELPKEYKTALKFKECHEDWIQQIDSMYMSYTKEMMYRTGIEEDKNNE